MPRSTHDQTHTVPNSPAATIAYASHATCTTASDTAARPDGRCRCAHVVTSPSVQMQATHHRHPAHSARTSPHSRSVVNSAPSAAFHTWMLPMASPLATTAPFWWTCDAMQRTVSAWPLYVLTLLNMNRGGGATGSAAPVPAPAPGPAPAPAPVPSSTSVEAAGGAIPDSSAAARDGSPCTLASPDDVTEATAPSPTGASRSAPLPASAGSARSHTATLRPKAAATTSLPSSAPPVSSAPASVIRVRRGRDVGTATVKHWTKSTLGPPEQHTLHTPTPDKRT